MQSVYLQRIMKKNAAKGYEKTNPIQTQFLQRPKMNVNAFSQKDYENETTFRLKKTNPNKANFRAYTNNRLVMRSSEKFEAKSAGQIIQISISPPPSVLRRESAFRRAQILGIFTATLLQFSCAQQFLANTIYSILPNFPRKTLAAVSGVKMGLLQGWFFSIGKTVFAANLYNFRPLQKLAEYQTFLKFSDHYCRYQY